MVCFAATQLADLLSGAATPELASYVDAHVDTCSDCRGLLLNLVRALSTPGSAQPRSQNLTLSGFAATDESTAPCPEAVGGRYRILAQLGQGGMGRVFSAYDRLNRTEVALKQVLWPSPTWESSSVAEPSAIARSIVAASRMRNQTTPPALDTFFAQYATARWSSATSRRLAVLATEFRTLATLRHPHIVSVLDYGFDLSGRPFYTMELLRSSQPIVQWAVGRSFPEKAELLLQLLDALTYLHRRGIVHRDVSSNNVLIVSADGRALVKVVDFGLALDRERAGDFVPAGTPLYMAPELYVGQPASVLSDLYAVGVLAYQLFCGRSPFSIEQGPADLLRQMLSGAPDVSALPLDVGRLLQALLSKQPQQRPSDAATVRRQLAAAAGIATHSEPVPTRDSYLIAARFVGRHVELKTLHAALTSARQGAGCGWLLSGESGVGKSRLLEELRCAALCEGVLTLRGQAKVSGDAYHLWLDVLRLIVLQVSLSQTELGVLTTVIPELPQILDCPVCSPPQLDPAAARLRLFHIIHDIWARLPGCSLLLLEDVQWADAESLALLSHLLGDVGKRAQLIVVTHRENEGSLPASIVAQLNRLHLPRLERAEIADLCQSMLGRAQIANELLDLVVTETEGNAYFIVEVMRVLAAETGSLADIGSARLPQRLFAGGIAEVLERRVARAPAEAQPLLLLAAVAGRDLDSSLLSHVLPNADAQLRALADVGLIELCMQHFRFSHDRLRERVQESLRPEQRQQLHRQVAAAMEALYAHDVAHAAQTAYHYRQGNELAKAAHYYTVAGDAALRRGAPTEAAALLEHAQHLHAQTQMPRLTQVRMWRGLTEARFGLGRLREAEAALRQLCEVAGTPLPSQPLHLWSRAAALTAELISRRIGHHFGQRLGLTSTTLITDSDDREVAAELLAGLGVEEVFVWTDQPALALLCTLSGISLEDRLGLTPRRNYHRTALFFILSHTPLHRLCLRYIEHAAARDASVLAGTHAEIDFLRVWALVEINDGKPARAAEHARRAVDLAREFKDDLALLHSLLQLQIAAAGLPDFALMLAVSREMEPLARRAQNTRYLNLAMVGQGAALINVGQYADAAQLLEQACAYLPEDLGPIPQSITLSLRASALRNLDQLDRATDLATQALQSVLGVRWHLVQLRHCLVCILDVYLAAPQIARWSVEIDAALARLHSLARRFPQAVPDDLLFHARHDWRAGRPQRAARGLRHCITSAHQLGLPCERAAAQYWLGLLAQTSEGAPFVPEGAALHLQAARRTFEQHKCQGMVDRIDRLLPGAPPPADSPLVRADAPTQTTIPRSVPNSP